MKLLSHFVILGDVNVNNCWVDTKGNVYFCANHIEFCKDYLFKNNLEDTFFDWVEKAKNNGHGHTTMFFETELRWVRYSTTCNDWVVIGRLTKAQRDKMYELTRYKEEEC